MKWVKDTELCVTEHTYEERERSEEDRAVVVGDLVHYYPFEERTMPRACIAVAEVWGKRNRYVILQPLKYQVKGHRGGVGLWRDVEPDEPIIVDAFSTDLSILQELTPFDPPYEPEE